MREMVKTVTHEIDGQEMTFKITKMNALHGSFLLKFVTEKIMPVLNGLQDVFTPINENDDKDEIIKKRTDAIIEVIPKALAAISEDELIAFEKKCLNTVEAETPLGEQKVMSGDKFVLANIEHDIISCLLLCYDVIEFNLGGFFGEKGLSSLLPRRNTALPDA